MTPSRAKAILSSGKSSQLLLRPPRQRLLPTLFASMASTSAAADDRTYKPRYIDIGINLADPIFRGRYHGSQRHPDDLNGVVQRARDVGCAKFMVTGSSFKSSREALKLAAQFPGEVFTTAGIHPCSSSIFSASHPHHHEADDEEHTAACDPDPTKPVDDKAGVDVDAAKSAQIIKDLQALVQGAAGKGLVALGEFGLDYDRLHFCPAPVQRHAFAAQLALAAALEPPLPLFLHSRACHADFVRLLKEAFGAKLERLARGGVVHSFTGTVGEMEELASLGLYIGVNGCSFKTAENCEVVKAIPLDRLMLETDGPWCEVRPSHAGWKYLLEPQAGALEEVGAASPEVGKKKGKKQPQKKEPEVSSPFKVVKKEKWEEGAMVKGRNEPCMIERVAKIVAAVKGLPLEEVCEAAWANTAKIFGLEEP